MQVASDVFCPSPLKGTWIVYSSFMVAVRRARVKVRTAKEQPVDGHLAASRETKNARKAPFHCHSQEIFYRFLQQQSAPKVSKGRAESPLVASAEAKPRETEESKEASFLAQTVKKPLGGVGGAAAPLTFIRVSRLCRLRGSLILLAKSIPYKFGRPLVDRICFLEKVVLTTFSTRCAGLHARCFLF